MACETTKAHIYKTTPLGTTPAPPRSAVVARNAHAQPHAIAFVEGVSGASMTWSEYDTSSDRIAGALAARARYAAAPAACDKSEAFLIFSTISASEISLNFPKSS